MDNANEGIEEEGKNKNKEKEKKKKNERRGWRREWKKNVTKARLQLKSRVQARWDDWGTGLAPPNPRPQGSSKKTRQQNDLEWWNEDTNTGHDSKRAIYLHHTLFYVCVDTNHYFWACVWCPWRVSGRGFFLILDVDLKGFELENTMPSRVPSLVEYLFLKSTVCGTSNLSFLSSYWKSMKGVFIIKKKIKYWHSMESKSCLTLFMYLSFI